MIQTTVSNIVSPAVTTHDPDALLNQVVGDAHQQFGFRARNRFEFLFQLVDTFTLLGDIGLIHLLGVDELIDQFFTNLVLHAAQHFLGLFIMLINGQTKSHSKFGIILKQGVGPGWSAAIFVFGPGRRR